ncbi:MAG: ABC transporter related protein [Magnetococcales bacterium]|nr:ABC transporter related protein [Magnetococcales bacterium]HIJ85896.1 ABC-F family ATP-binding cassette domain-containing protein [Magnetococcales bacterium]
MLFIEEVQKSFGSKRLFTSSSLTINRGEKVALIGPNGSGKTSLFHMIAGSLDCDEGRIRLAGGIKIGILAQELIPSRRPILEETLEGDPELVQLRQQRARLNQSLLEQDSPEPGLVEQVGEIDHQLEALGSFSAESRAGTILHGLGFSKDDQGRPLDTFSGGWRMRIALARLLFSRADLLLLDEPTNHLDLESAAWLERFIQTSPVTHIIISHDRGFINRTTKVTVAIENKVVNRYSAGFERYLVMRQEKLLQLEKLADKQGREIEHLERFIRRFRAKATKAKQVQSRIKRLEKIDPVTLAAQAKHLERVRLPEPPPSAREVLTLNGVGKSFGPVHVFSEVTLRLERGQKVGLLGPNGAGKSTLLKIINQTLTPDRGEVILGDRVVSGHFAQHAMEALMAGETLMASAARAAKAGMATEKIRSLLGGFLFSGEDVFKTVAVLSGGEKARLALARLFLASPNLLLLDEPTNHLDMESRAALEEGLSDYSGSMILVTHDRDLMETVCDRFWLIAQGRIVLWDGDLNDYLEQISNQKISAMDSPIVEKSSPKDRRREAAQRRQAVDRATRDLRKEINTLEKEIASLETALAEVRQRLSDPGLHTKENKEPLLRHLTENGRLETRLSTVMAQWEELSLALETHRIP